MAFRKRNVAVTRPQKESTGPNETTGKSAPGVRPSFLTSHPTTSTGCSSLDSLLGGHGGLVLGSSLLIEESGTTDFAGALLKYYAAEGICHGHVLHVVGVGEGWVRELPGVAEERSESSRRGKDVQHGKAEEERMKIAWRYESLGQAGERGAWRIPYQRYISPKLIRRRFLSASRLPLTVSTALPDRSSPASATPDPAQQETPFCHTFDLTKRLTIPPDAKINHIPISSSMNSAPFDTIIRLLEQKLQTSPPNTIHRLLIPTILSPALYPPQASRPEHILRFLHALRSLLRRYPTNLTAILTLPLSLHPRHKGLTRFAETLSDGVLELTPFPHLMDTLSETDGSSSSKREDQQPQGMLKVHKLPINTERGEGGAGAGNSIGEDLAFTVSRRKFVVAPFALPPVEGDQEGQSEGGSLTKKDVEF